MDTADYTAKMVLLPNDKDIWVSGMLAKGLAYEPFETRWIQYLVRPGDVVLDIGAHIGYYTLLLSQIVGAEGRVIAFEPDPANFAILQQNIVLNGCRNVTLYNLAVSDRNGPLSLYLSDNNAGDHRVWKPSITRPSVTVQAIALDPFLGGGPLRINFIKMDIQGAEGAAMKGMIELLRRQPTFTLVTEFWPYGLEQMGTSATQYLQYLADLSCDLFLIDERNRRLVQIQGQDLVRSLAGNNDAFVNLLCPRRSSGT